MLCVASESFEPAFQSVHTGLNVPQNFVEFAHRALEMGEKLLKTDYPGGEVLQVIGRWFVHGIPQITPAGRW